MTPKGLAEQLVKEFTDVLNNTLDVSYMYSCIENVNVAGKKCAAICVGYMMKEANEELYPFLRTTIEEIEVLPD